MNTMLLVLAVLSFVVAIWAACRRDAPTATAATVGSILFVLLAAAVGHDHERDRWDA
jgi:hypothetical protein